MKKLLIATSITMALTSISANASGFDTRSFAMGGVGVSTADYLTAPFHNPALVAKYDTEDDFGLLIPSVGGSVQSSEDFLSNIDDASSGIDGFENGSISNPAQIQSEIIDPLSKLENNSAHAMAGLGVAFAMPNSKVSFNVYAQSYARLNVRAEINQADLDASNYVSGYQPTSQVTALGVAVTEYGAAFAKSYALADGTFYVGVTPKIQQLTALNYTADVRNYEMNDSLDNNTSDKTAFNMDIGVAYSLNNGVTVGLAGKNIISQSLEASEYMGKSAKYTLNGIYVASASYSDDFFTVGADLDLNKSKNMTSYSGFSSNINASDDDTQMFALGAEFNAWDWAQLRVGYNTDLQGNLDDEISAGIGLVPFQVFHLALSASYAGDSQFGGSIQTYFTF